MIEINRILCPIDFSAFSERALAYAMKMAVWYGAKLQVLHVMPPLAPSTTSELAETTRELTRRNLENTVERHRLPGAAVATELIESSEPYVVSVVAGTSLVFLTALGALSASTGGAPVFRASARVAFWGALAMGLTAVAGRLVGTVV